MNIFRQLRVDNAFPQFVTFIVQVQAISFKIAFVRVAVFIQHLVIDIDELPVFVMIGNFLFNNLIGKF